MISTKTNGKLALNINRIASFNGTGNRNGKPAPAVNRIDAVFIRKSTSKQDEESQQGNVEKLLKARDVTVPKDNWYFGTVSRRKVETNDAFNEMICAVEQGRIGTVYVESQDRFGSEDFVEFCHYIRIFRDHGTRLFDLKLGKDLTDGDVAVQLLAHVNGIKSEKELQDLSYRSIRTRVELFQDLATWQGVQPFGYGKRFYDKDGKLLWEWQPASRFKGQLFYPDGDIFYKEKGPNTGGTLKPGQENVKIQKKEKRQRTVLVPSNDPKRIEAVRLIYDLYTRVELSRRQIAVRLNGGGFSLYGNRFGHTDITNIMTNPAYVGDACFGRTRKGELWTFDSEGNVNEIKGKRGHSRRDPDECLVKENTHEALIDRKTWEQAQKKLRTEREKTCYAPRNPNYYLKRLLVCGHCGRGMAAVTKTASGKRIVYYVCSSHTSARILGHSTECGYHRISHADAERLLLDKIAELGLEYDAAVSEGARGNIKQRLERLGRLDEESAKQWETILMEGVDAFAGFLTENYGIDYPVLPKLRKWAMNVYLGDGTAGKLSLAKMTKGLGDLKTAIAKVEADTASAAKRELDALREEYAAYTRNWAKTTSDMQQAVLKREMDRLEASIRALESKTVPLSERLDALYAAEAEAQAERYRLTAELPTLENREKGEAYRRLFKSVKLFWERQWVPFRDKRRCKSSEPGRYRFLLQEGRTEWDLHGLDSGKPIGNSRMPCGDRRAGPSAPWRRRG